MKRSDDELTRLDVPPARPLGAERKAALKKDVLLRIGGAGRPDDERFAGVRRRILVLVLAAVVLGALLGSLTTAYALDDPGAPSASSESLVAISTEGARVTLKRQSQALTDSAQAFLMATRGSTAYLRLPPRNGDDCFYTGRAAEHGTYELGGGSCWTPSPRFPVLDLSPIQASGPGGFKVLQVQGFAADGVTAIALKDLDGRRIAETAVQDNVYRLTAYPPGAVSIVALDAGDHVLQRIDYRP